MRRTIRLLLAAAIVAGALVGAGVPASAASPTYYVSLGDSLAGGGFRQYPDQLFRIVRGDFNGLHLVKLGCGGATTDSLISGGGCTYPSGSQLDQALKILRLHSGDIAFITIDIGANDVLGPCWDLDTGVIDQPCVQGELPHIEMNIAYIIDTLQAAAPGVPVLGMSYYDPFLGYWVTRSNGQTLAQLDEASMEALNAGLVSSYESAGAIVADVAGPDFFNIADFTDMVVSEEFGEIPVNVANACAWTLFCDFEDVHPNTTGHGVIAAAFAAVLPA